MDDNCLFMFCYSMSSETAVTYTGGHFNQAVFAVSYISGEFLGCMLVVEMLEMQPNRSSEESN